MMVILDRQRPERAAVRGWRAWENGNRATYVLTANMQQAPMKRSVLDQFATIF
jgi:hypothetical protein